MDPLISGVAAPNKTYCSNSTNIPDTIMNMVFALKLVEQNPKSQTIFKFLPSRYLS